MDLKSEHMCVTINVFEGGRYFLIIVKLFIMFFVSRNTMSKIDQCWSLKSLMTLYVHVQINIVIINISFSITDKYWKILNSDFQYSFKGNISAFYFLNIRRKKIQTTIPSKTKKVWDFPIPKVMLSKPKEEGHGP